MATPLPRSQFPVTERSRYFNHAGVGPLSLAAHDAILRATHDFTHRGGPAFDVWGEEHEQHVRASAGQLLGVPSADIAFVKNTTEGLGFVANGIDWQAGDRVLVPDHEFPSTLYPWLSLRDRGVEVDIIETVGPGRTLPLERFAEALAAKPTRLVAVSWVQFGRGWRTDLAGLGTLCREHGALLCADVIQGLGVLPAELEAWQVDFAMADAHKWMLGPLGIGVFYVAERSRELLRPLEPGWASVAHREEWDNLELVYADDATRFEGGSVNTLTVAGMGAAIDLLLETGVDAIWSHVDGLCTRLADGLDAQGLVVLSDRSAEGRSGVITVDTGEADPADVAERLNEADFVCSPRGGGVRLAPHGYNTADEVDALVEAFPRALG